MASCVKSVREVSGGRRGVFLVLFSRTFFSWSFQSFPGLVAFTKPQRTEPATAGLELAGLEPVDIPGNTEPLLDHAGGAFGMILTQVMELGAVLREVIEFPSPTLGSNDLPIPFSQGSVRAEMLVKSFVATPLSALENGGEGLALERIDGA